ncbi:Nin one binding Zn-ribbon like-domain-containing protein [Rhodofomes roseus]|uniref:20S-pre-rRNA D-site endonuclease NOB1 n=1 Tax=Rhodofomes roseus TaxID=34475 RepID=A0ABQ8K9T0_9APHY|nr:Nin one binding Zn-ribbon like-domain-containing protein [Rhodofomes roseus]KAH9833734.1 Nin one binding Zn-ribbon like-domain-containing protein [Rhodofomes roseus]
MASSSTTTKPTCKHLVLDAGPLLSLSPLRGLAETYYTVPQVLDELKDKRAREHFQQLGLSAGVRIDVRGPDATSLAHVIQFAKKTGDYSVLSHADLCVLALTYALDVKEKEQAKPTGENPQTQDESATSSAAQGTQDKISSTEEHKHDAEVTESGTNDALDAETEADEEEPLESDTPSSDSDGDDTGEETKTDTHDEAAENDEQPREPLDVELHPIQDQEEQPKDAPASSSHPPSSTSPSTTPPTTTRPTQAPPEPIYDDPSDEEDGEGEWITPSNVALHKSRALNLLPSDDARKGKAKQEHIPVGCMTADFAMQNVLLQMGLGLVSVDGKRIERVKSWVLRCHACFKICKDNARKFCPSCGNPTLLRTSVTISSPNAGPNTPALQVHLKKNFQYKTRGTIYSIPTPKPGSAKGGPGEGLILREDQLAWQRAKKRADGKREREERRMLTAATRGGIGEGGAVLSSWMDPDWVPEILSAGAGGKGRNMRSRGFDGDMPIIGHGKKNPNERRRTK